MGNSSGFNIPDINFIPAFSFIADKAVAFYPYLVEFIKDLIGILIGISFPISLLFLIIIIYSVERLKVIRKKEEAIYDLKVVPAYDTVDKADPALANRWESVQRHIESENPNDWRQAILEADIILDNILEAMGYRGESIGEKLKRVAKGDFKTLDEAWEAHKVRNMIAHEGNTFVIGHHEAKRIINLYKKVFEEFYYI